MDRPPQPQPNLLSPFTSLKWRECKKMPVSVLNAQAVVLGKKVYLGGGSMNPMLPPRLLIYDFTEDSWDTVDTPTQWYALATYHSKLVLVGGRNLNTKEATNQLWVLDEQNRWTQPLPPMTTKRYKASAVSLGNHLIVAGGQGGSHACPLDEVEMYDGHQWKKVESLPRECTWMKSTLHERNWYLAGGSGQGSEVYQTSLESLIVTSEGAGQTSVWKKLPDAPLELSATVMFRDQLITIGGGKPLSSAIHAYSPSTNSWVHVGDLPDDCHSTCAVVLPTGELLVVGGENESGLLHCPFRADVGIPLSPTRLPDSQEETSLEITVDNIQIEELAQEIHQLLQVSSSTVSLISKSEKEVLKIELDVSSIEKKEQQTKPDCRDLAVQTSHSCREVAVQTHDEATAMETNDYLRGMDVIAETSVPITNQARTFNWKGYGLKLHIPKGSLPAGLEECRLLIKAGLSGQFTLPQNTSLVSAVYWIDSEPRRKFSKHLTVEIQHCVKLTHSSKLSFVHAKCSQTHIPYKFEAMEGGMFSSDHTYGCMQLTHFSMVGVVSNEPVVRLYHAYLCYLRSGMNLREMHFVITWDTESHTTVVRQEYTNKGATIGLNLQVEFESDSIYLQLPSEEETLNGGWKIIPLIYPRITKKQVDSFTPSREIPSCQLTAEWIGDSRPSRLIHKVTLEGAKEPSNFFRIVLGADPARHQLTSTSSDISVEYSQAPTPDMTDLMKALYHTVADKWKLIGIHLHIPMATLNIICTEHQNDPHQCLIGMLEVWLKIEDPLPTWSAITEAVEFLGENQLARELREKYCQ